MVANAADTRTGSVILSCMLRNCFDYDPHQIAKLPLSPSNYPQRYRTVHDINEGSEGHLLLHSLTIHVLPQHTRTCNSLVRNAILVSSSQSR